MSKKLFKVDFVTLEECRIKNYAEVEAETKEEAKEIIEKCVKYNINPYCAYDEKIKSVEWENGNVFDIVESISGIRDASEDIYDIGEHIEKIKEKKTVKITIPMYVNFEIPTDELTEEQVEKLKKVSGETPACLIRYAGAEPERLSEEEIEDIYEEVVYPLSREIIRDPEKYNPKIGTEIEEPDETTAIFVEVTKKESK